MVKGDGRGLNRNGGDVGRKEGRLRHVVLMNMLTQVRCDRDLVMT